MPQHFALSSKIEKILCKELTFSPFSLQRIFFRKVKFSFYSSLCTFLSSFRIYLQRTILPGALYAYPAFSF